MADQLNFKAKITSRRVTLWWMVPQKVTLPKISATQLMQNDWVGKISPLGIFPLNSADCFLVYIQSQFLHFIF